MRSPWRLASKPWPLTVPIQNDRIGKRRPMTASKKEEQGCPCGSTRSLASCCQGIINGKRSASSAEELMRSRYTAYALNDPDYLLLSWSPAHRPSSLSLDQAQHWLGLKIIETTLGEAGDETGTVEFVARFKIGGRAHRLHEVSQFMKIDGLWVYSSGELI